MRKNYCKCQASIKFSWFVGLLSLLTIMVTSIQATGSDRFYLRSTHPGQPGFENDHTGHTPASAFGVWLPDFGFHYHSEVSSFAHSSVIAWTEAAPASSFSVDNTSLSSPNQITTLPFGYPGFPDGGKAGTINYVNSNGYVIWTADPIYKYDIAGIGRDDLAAQNQKQSQSINESTVVAMALGPLAASNKENSSVFENDTTFVIWGNDGANFSSGSKAATDWYSTDVAFTTYLRVKREWKVIVTGGSAITVYLYSSGLPGFSGTADTYYVLQDKNGDFTEGLVTATPMTGSPVPYAVVTFQPGASYFTFAENQNLEIHLLSTNPATGAEATSPAFNVETNVAVGNDVMVDYTFSAGSTNPASSADLTAGSFPTGT
ncbi:MAG: hypothetical protein EOL88_05900, partial [Bacteroidia bacterium]|nr:hypothetical protein [Bacteroidia bacterium]